MMRKWKRRRRRRKSKFVVQKLKWKERNGKEIVSMDTSAMFCCNVVAP